MWTIQSKGEGAQKDVFALWVPKALRRALTVDNILSGFHATGIYPFINTTMNSTMSSSSAYFKVHEED
jgi:hypothetical protein